MATILRRRRERQRTAADWTATNEVLLAGEWGYETDTGKVKIGDGTATWTGLPYTGGGGGGAGTTVHNDLTGRSTVGAHPTSAITGLDAALTAKASTADLAAEQTARADADAVRVLSTDARLSDARTPTDGSVTAAKLADSAVVSRVLNDGSVTDAKVSATAAIAESKLALASDAAAGTASRRTLGTGATQAAAGNDARLSDARTPTAGTVVDASIGATAAIAESKLALASDAVAATASRRTLGTGAQQAAAGNDARFTDTRTPADLSVTDAKVAAANKDGTAATASMRTLGVGSGQALPGNHASTTDARTPTAHAGSHATAGTDAVALAASQITSGTLGVARLATGTAAAGMYPDGAGAWTTLPSSSGGMPATLVDAKGDLLVATADDTVARQAVGVNGQVLTADSTVATGVSWVGLRYKAASYYAPQPAGIGTVVVAASKVQAQPFDDHPPAFDRIGVEVTTAVAGTTARLYVWAQAADGTPGAVLVDAGPIDTATVGFKEITVASTALPPGRVFVGLWQSNVGAPTYRSNMADFTTPPGMPVATTGTAIRNCWMQTSVTTTVNPFPTTATTATGTPRVLLRAA